MFSNQHVGKINPLLIFKNVRCYNTCPKRYFPIKYVDMLKTQRNVENFQEVGTYVKQPWCSFRILMMTINFPHHHTYKQHEPSACINKTSICHCTVNVKKQPRKRHAYNLRMSTACVFCVPKCRKLGIHCGF